MYMLNSFIKKVDGNNGCTLINLENSDVIDLGNREALLLTSLLNNSYDGLDNELKTYLIENNWIVEVNNMSKSENLNYLKMELQGMTDFTLKKVLLELSTNCSLNCIYCDENSDNAFASCTCKRWNYNKVKTDYHELAEQIVSFDVEKIIIIGGDPFFDSFENLKELLFFLKEEGYKNEIVIYTNGSCLDNEKVLFIKEYKNIRINIMFLGCNEEDYKYITNTSGTLKKVIWTYVNTLDTKSRTFFCIN